MRMKTLLGTAIAVAMLTVGASTGAFAAEMLGKSTFNSGPLNGAEVFVTKTIELQAPFAAEQRETLVELAAPDAANQRAEIPAYGILILAIEDSGATQNMREVELAKIDDGDTVPFAGGPKDIQARTPGGTYGDKLAAIDPGPDTGTIGVEFDKVAAMASDVGQTRAPSGGHGTIGIAPPVS